MRLFFSPWFPFFVVAWPGARVVSSVEMGDAAEKGRIDGGQFGGEEGVDAEEQRLHGRAFHFLGLDLLTGFVLEVEFERGLAVVRGPLQLRELVAPHDDATFRVVEGEAAGKVQRQTAELALPRAAVGLGLQPADGHVGRHVPGLLEVDQVPMRLDGEVVRIPAAGLHVEGEATLVQTLRFIQNAQHAFRDDVRRRAPDPVPRVHRGLVQHEQARTLDGGENHEMARYEVGEQLVAFHQKMGQVPTKKKKEGQVTGRKDKNTRRVSPYVTLIAKNRGRQTGHVRELAILSPTQQT